MSNIEVFAKQTKKRIIYSAILIGLLISAMLLRYFYESSYIFTIRVDIIASVLQVAALPFAFLLVKNLKCPSCKENAGNGWNIKNAKTAGRSLNRKAPNKRLQRRYSASRLQTAVEPNVRKGKYERLLSLL
ncbi:hypothetical protein [Cellvibrio sp. KY-GH-1]|uniref:hypothetical protein n=1 Tax=Cellvibrio sp. KY-GH-1 TaxID=2303332 RepID=UPI0012456321|nr:hypothetical protein [Cellvibrio sp. KY-GH-1]